MQSFHPRDPKSYPWNKPEHQSHKSTCWHYAIDLLRCRRYLKKLKPRVNHSISSQNAAHCFTWGLLPGYPQEMMPLVLSATGFCWALGRFYLTNTVRFVTGQVLHFVLGSRKYRNAFPSLTIGQGMMVCFSYVNGSFQTSTFFLSYFPFLNLNFLTYFFILF